MKAMLDEQKRWQEQRHAELSSPDSWLGLVGLDWLEAGLNSVGSAEDAVVRLPGGPAHLGYLRWEEGRIVWQPAEGEPCPLQTDLDGPPTTVDYENWSFFIVDRSGRLAARVRDRHWAAQRPWAGLAYFDFDPAWRIEAAWRPLSPSIQMAVPNVSGELQTVAVTHQAVFEVAGQQVALLPMSIGENEVFFVFRDRSSGRETYGAGRFLKAAPPHLGATAGPPGEGRIMLDFNRAYNPPCAFTSFATCPLPPPENWLPFAVPAGEKKPGAASG